MVLINNLTVDEINAALLHLQRSQNEVVGGEKGTTIQNITITNQGGGSGVAGQDWSLIINALENRINTNEQTDNTQAEQIAGIMEQLMSLSANGITNLQFDATNRYLIIYTEDGNTYDVQITSEPITMTLDSTTNKLTLVMGSQTQEVTLPYINASQKGVAGGVATLDESGRVPYSQLPESAMQSDWTETDSTDPSFIKHKIPIWITNSSADDNMSPVDAVTDGEMRPVTSNAVYNKHYLTSADITNQVTVNNMQSVSSNAVAQKFSNFLSIQNAIFVRANTPTKLPIPVNAGETFRDAYLVMNCGHYSTGSSTYAYLYLLRVGYSGNFHTETLIASSGTRSPYTFSFDVSSDGYITVTSTISTMVYVI